MYDPVTPRLHSSLPIPEQNVPIHALQKANRNYLFPLEFRILAPIVSIVLRQDLTYLCLLVFGAANAHTAVKSEVLDSLETLQTLVIFEMLDKFIDAVDIPSVEVERQTL